MNHLLEFRLPFFETVCRDVFSGWLATEGFRETQVKPRGGIRFMRGDVFIEMTYYPEDRPNYSAMATLGVIERVAGSSRELGFGLWKVVPDDAPERGYSLWSFLSEEETRRVLVRVRDEVVREYAPELWGDPSRIRAIAAR